MSAAETDQGDELELPIGTVEDILAVDDLTTKVVPVPEWECSVRIRSLTAAQSTQVKQLSITLGKKTDVSWADMEKTQFELGVIEPRFPKQRVNQLHHKSGPGFARVIKAIDEISGIDKEELAAARESFPESDE